MLPLPASFDHRGYLLIPSVIDADLIDSTLSSLPSERPANVRLALTVYPQLRQLAAAALAAVSLSDSRVVRSIFFDKAAGTNWSVLWHQDSTICVKEPSVRKGYGPWSLKAGIPHVQPPAAVMEQIITLRLHCDDCPEENGPLKVIPGSHRRGILSRPQIREICSSENAEIVSCRKGDLLLMKPLLLHSSSCSSAPAHRRILHLETAAFDLEGMEWGES